MPFSDHIFLSDLEKFDSFAFKFLSKREVVIQDCEYTGIVFSDRAKSIFFDELSQDESSNLYLNTKISAHSITSSFDDYTKAQQTVFSVIYNKRAQNIILKADREQMPDFVSPEYESAIFVIAKKDSDYFAFVDKSYSKIKMLLEKLSLATTVAEYVKV